MPPLNVSIHSVPGCHLTHAAAQLAVGEGGRRNTQWGKVKTHSGENRRRRRNTQKRKVDTEGGEKSKHTVEKSQHRREEKEHTEEKSQNTRGEEEFADKQIQI